MVNIPQTISEVWSMNSKLTLCALRASSTLLTLFTL